MPTKCAASNSADVQGLSFYSDRAIGRHLKTDSLQLSAARQQLVQADLIAYQKPLYQVLALPEDSKVPAPTLPRSGQTQSVADILRRVVEGGQAVSAPWPLTAADGRYPADKLGR